MTESRNDPMGPDGFHPDAHPDATEITGEREYGEWGQCISEASTTDARCTQPAKGAHGKCHTHGGADGSGPPEGNVNASTHHLYTDADRFYQEIIGDGLRELCDRIFESYVEKFRQINGAPVAAEQARLFEISINQIKIIHSDNWAVDKPDDLESGNAFVDKETRIKTTEHDAREEERYTESPVVKTQQRLRKEDRKWLKEMGLLGPDIDVSVDGQVDHEHDHGLDDATEEIIDDLAENLKA